MPISSSPVNMLSAWCHVAWEKTRLCILSSELPWCTQRRLNPSKDASSSSTTLTVSSRALLCHSILRKPTQSSALYLTFSSAQSCSSGLFCSVLSLVVSFLLPFFLSCFLTHSCFVLSFFFPPDQTFHPPHFISYFLSHRLSQVVVFASWFYS